MSEPNEKFWMVCEAGGKAYDVSYKTLAAAKRGAEWEARHNPNSAFCVLEAIQFVRGIHPVPPPLLPVTWAEAKAKVEPAAPRWPEWRCETCKAIIPHFSYPCPNCCPSQPPTPETP